MKIRMAAAAGLALALGVSACAPSDDAAGEDGPIKVGLIADLSGATADVGTPYHEGMLGYIDSINEDGGIDGREIEALAEDYAYNPDTAVTLYDRFVGEGAVVIQGWGTGDTNILAEKITNDAVHVGVLRREPHGSVDPPVQLRRRGDVLRPDAHRAQLDRRGRRRAGRGRRLPPRLGVR